MKKSHKTANQLVAHALLFNGRHFDPQYSEFWVVISETENDSYRKEIDLNEFFIFFSFTFCVQSKILNYRYFDQTWLTLTRHWNCENSRIANKMSIRCGEYSVSQTSLIDQIWSFAFHFIGDFERCRDRSHVIFDCLCPIFNIAQFLLFINDRDKKVMISFIIFLGWI